MIVANPGIAMLADASGAVQAFRPVLQDRDRARLRLRRLHRSGQHQHRRLRIDRARGYAATRRRYRQRRNLHRLGRLSAIPRPSEAVITATGDRRPAVRGASASDPANRGRCCPTLRKAFQRTRGILIVGQRGDQFRAGNHRQDQRSWSQRQHVPVQLDTAGTSSNSNCDGRINFIDQSDSRAHRNSRASLCAYRHRDRDCEPDCEMTIKMTSRISDGRR